MNFVSSEMVKTRKEHRRWGLLRAYGWRAFLRGYGTDEEYKRYKAKSRGK